MIARFKVGRVTTIEREDTPPHYLLFLVPFVPEFDGEDDNPVDDLIYNVQFDAVPRGFEFCRLQDVGNDSGVEIESAEKVAPGTVVDLEIRVAQVVS